MFAEEALWLRAVLDSVPVRDGTTVLDVGSQTLEFRTVLQPYIDREIFVPLRERGADITHLDARAAEGVDIVADITAEEFSLHGRAPFDVVICTNLLEHVVNRSATIQRLREATAGHLIVTVPAHYPYHEDPIDTMYRPSPSTLAGDVSAVAPALTPVRTGSIHVLERCWYKSRRSRLRRFVPPLRWRTSAVLFRARAAS